MLSFIVPRSGWKTLIWVVFLCLVIAFRWFGGVVLTAGDDPSIQVRCTPTSFSTVYDTQSCTIP